MQVLLAMKANVEDRGIKGDCTPLMEAASGGHVDIVKLLINHHADVNAQSTAGKTLMEGWMTWRDEWNRGWEADIEFLLNFWMLKLDTLEFPCHDQVRLETLNIPHDNDVVILVLPAYFYPYNSPSDFSFFLLEPSYSKIQLLLSPMFFCCWCMLTDYKLSYKEFCSNDAY